MIDGVWIGNQIYWTLLTHNLCLRYQTRTGVLSQSSLCSWVMSSNNGHMFLSLQAGGHLTPTSYSSNCHLRSLSKLKLKVKVKVTLWPTVSWPVCLAVKQHLEHKTRFLFLSEGCRFVHVGRPLWREDESLIYNCCWPLPVQSHIPWSK
jgi:hypothetical protein